MRRVVMITLMLIMLSIAVAAADSTGCVYGTVCEEDSGEPVIGARVMIEGTTLGAMVNPMNGNYEIRRIPAGTYTVVASCIGYKRVAVDSVVVQSGGSIVLDFELESQQIQIDIVMLGWRWCHIDKYITHSITRLNQREIERLPTTNLQGILKYTAGVMDSDGTLHIRGSRGDEVGFIDDGVFIRDQLGGY